jgi:hypothetical protein
MARSRLVIVVEVRVAGIGWNSATGTSGTSGLAVTSSSSVWLRRLRSH